MRNFLLLALIVTTGRLHAQTIDSVTIEVNSLRDEFVSKIKGLGFSPSVPPPKIVFDNPRSFGNYDEDSNVLHTSDWGTLDPASKARFAAAAERIGNGMTAESYFELSVHRWILVHELGHWWRACQHQMAKPYESEMAANRIAIAFWREKDPAFMAFKLAGYQQLLKVLPSPVPVGALKVEFLNSNYDKLPSGQGYTWYQASMIVDGCNESPAPTFRQAIERSGNASN